MSNAAYLKELERESRQLAVDVGDNDLLGGPYLFAILAIRLCGVSRGDVVKSYTMPPDFEKKGYVYPGARCPSYVTPVSIATSIAEEAGRAVNDIDVWLALREHNRQDFDSLCEKFGIGLKI